MGLHWNCFNNRFTRIFLRLHLQVFSWNNQDSNKSVNGAIAWMTRNAVASNLLMGILLLAGFFSVLQTKQEVFPGFSIDIISVTVPYPGASPEEVEQGIILAVEEELRGLMVLNGLTPMLPKMLVLSL